MGVLHGDRHGPAAQAHRGSLSPGQVDKGEAPGFINHRQTGDHPRRHRHVDGFSGFRKGGRCAPPPPPHAVAHLPVHHQQLAFAPSGCDLHAAGHGFGQPQGRERRMLGEPNLNDPGSVPRGRDLHPHRKGVHLQRERRGRRHLRRAQGLSGLVGGSHVLFPQREKPHRGLRAVGLAVNSSRKLVRLYRSCREQEQRHPKDHASPPVNFGPF
ncbi:hypothetical protein HRbin09_00031 [bacterium HR09]|nr:hypothetical protein HRbin09_00031 [bacterium HR09]